MRFYVALSVVVGPAVLAACDALITDPAPATAEVEVSFQIGGPPAGGSAVAFSRVRRVFLRFVGPDSVPRDTVVNVVPFNNRVRAALVLKPKEHITALGIGAQLGYGTTALFQGAAIVLIEPGAPTSAEIPLAPIPTAVVSDRPALTLLGPGASDQLTSAVLFASGDTIDGLQGIWTSEDPAIVAVTPTGLAIAQQLGTTNLEVRFDTLADTIQAQVLPPLPGGLVSWASPVSGAWNTATNWSTGSVPAAGDSVVIDLDGTYAVTLDTSPTVASLTIGGVTGSQTLTTAGQNVTVTGVVDLSGTGTMDVNMSVLTAGGVVNRSPTGSLTVHASSVLAPVDNQGTILVLGNSTVSALTTSPTSLVRLEGQAVAAALTVSNPFTNTGTIELASTGTANATMGVLNGVFVNAPSGTIIATDPQNHIFSADLNNQGTITSAAQTLQLWTATAGGTLTNSGTIAATVGSLSFVTNFGGLNNSGGITVTGGGNLTFGLGGGTLTTSGTISTGTGTLTLNGGLLNYTSGSLGVGEVAVFNNINATFTPPMTLGVDGPMNFTASSSSVAAPGLTVGAATTLVLDNGTLNAPVVNQGTLVSRGSSAINGAFTTDPVSLLRIEGLGGLGVLTFASGFTNREQIQMFQTGGGTAQMIVTSGTLVNAPTGTIDAGASVNTLTGDLQNQGAITATAGQLVLTGATLDNSGTITAGVGALDVSITAGAGSFTNGGTLDTSLGGNVSVSVGGGGVFSTGGIVTTGGTLDVSGPLDYTGGSFAVGETVDIADGTATFSPTMSLGVDGPSVLNLLRATLDGPGLTIPPGTTASANASVVNPPVNVQGTLFAFGTTDMNGALTTASGSQLRVQGLAGLPAVVNVANAYTNNGLIELTSLASGVDATLAVLNGTLGNSATGTIDALAGAGLGNRTIAASAVGTIGTINLTAPLTITGQLIDPVGAPSTYTGNGSTLSVGGLDVDGAVFGNMPLVSTGGAITQFNNVTFQSMDPTATQLTIVHPGAALGAFTFTGLTFSTAPVGGFYMSITDSDALAPFLQVNVISSFPVSGIGQSLFAGGAILNW